jgi:hypothetical protein
MTDNLDELNYLKTAFYDIDDIGRVDMCKLNKSLNLFYGLKPDPNPSWKSFFKGVVKLNNGKSKKGKQSYEDVAIADFNNLKPEEIIKVVFDKKKDIKDKLNCLYKNEQNFKSTIIYEAPSFLSILTKKDDTLKCEFVAEFILDDICSSPYANSIRGCFGEQETKMIDLLKKYDCGFFDVIPMPLPINSDLRNRWATDDKFKFNNKRIFVHFFEWAVEQYKTKAKISNEQKHKIAVGIPLNNAITLYENYAPNRNVEFGEHANQIITFNTPHSINLNHKKNGLWLHPFKNCVISTSNTPNAELMKLALE